MKNEMTGKERWLATFASKPVDRLVFWPKITYAYALHRNKQSVDYAGLAGSDKHSWSGSVFKEEYTNGASYSDIALDELTKRHIFKTKYGELKGLSKFDAKTHTWHPVEYPVQSLNDLKIMTEWFLAKVNTPDRDKIAAEKEQYKRHGEDTLVAAVIKGDTKGKSPLMNFLEFIAGIETGQYLLIDHPDETAALFEAMHKSLLTQLQITAEHSPADMVYLFEDTSTTLISPAQYKDHCFNMINDYGRALHAGGKLFALHMCGHLKALLPMLNETVSDIFEALSPPTVGDTDLVTARAACPTKAFMGGTNATMWQTSPQETIDYLQSQFDALPHLRGLVITSGGEMPPSCDLDYIKKVGDFVKSVR